jgi:hypothetical protein
MNYTFVASPLVPSTVTKRKWRAVISRNEELWTDVIIEYRATLEQIEWQSKWNAQSLCTCCSRQQLLAAWYSAWSRHQHHRTYLVRGTGLHWWQCIQQLIIPSWHVTLSGNLSITIMCMHVSGKHCSSPSHQEINVGLRLLNLPVS